MWPDPLRAGAYQLEIISTVLQGSGMVHGIKQLCCLVTSHMCLPSKRKDGFLHISKEGNGIHGSVKVETKANRDW